MRQMVSVSTGAPLSRSRQPCVATCATLPPRARTTRVPASLPLSTQPATCRSSLRSRPGSSPTSTGSTSGARLSTHPTAFLLLPETLGGPSSRGEACRLDRGPGGDLGGGADEGGDGQRAGGLRPGDRQGA